MANLRVVRDQTSLDNVVISMIEQIEELIKTPPKTSRVIYFRPEVAKHILETRNDLKIDKRRTSSTNRPKSQADIKKYAKAMKNGRWGLTGDTIKFGTDGLLKDGQHRLEACVLAGKPFTTHVVFGVDPKLFARMDQGRNRSAKDIFAMAGVPYPGDTSSAVRWLIQFRKPGTRGAQIDKEELFEEYVSQFGDVFDSVVIGRRVCSVFKFMAGNMAAFHYTFAKLNKEKADEFFERWIAGRSAGPGDPISVLDKKLEEYKHRFNGRVHETVRNATIVLAWNAFVRGEKTSLAKLEWRLDDTFPAIEG